MRRRAKTILSTLQTRKNKQTEQSFLANKNKFYLNPKTELKQYSFLKLTKKNLTYQSTKITPKSKLISEKIRIFKERKTNIPLKPGKVNRQR